MKTSKEKKDNFINMGSEISKELYSVFGKDEKITIADIGCCDGLDTIIYSRMFPNALIHSFEPIEENYNEAILNFCEYDIFDRVMIHNCALGRKQGKATFWRSYGQAEGIKDWDTGNKSSSLYKPRNHILVHPWCKFKESQVDVYRLDDMKIAGIDFAHIDVQGAEMDVLVGGIDTLRDAQLLWLEVANVFLYANQPLKNSIVEYLRHKGFRVIKDTCGTKRDGDVLFGR